MALLCRVNHSAGPNMSGFVVYPVIVCATFIVSGILFSFSLKMSSLDAINRMPVNQQQRPTPQEIRVMDAVFGDPAVLSSSSSSFGNVSASELLIPGGLFLALSLPFVDKFLKGYITASDMVMLVIKLGIFLALLLLFQLIGWA